MSWDAVLPAISGLIGAGLGGGIAHFTQMKAIEWQVKQEEETRKADEQKWIDQTWWQKKESAYAEIIEALWGSYHDDSEYQDYVIGFNGPNAKAPQPIRDWHKDRLTIERAADMGAFYISTGASERLRDYLKLLYKIDFDDNFIDVLDELILETKKCLDEIKAEASKDLRLRQPG